MTLAITVIAILAMVVSVAGLLTAIFYNPSSDNVVKETEVVKDVEARSVFIDANDGVALDIIGEGDNRAQMRIRSENTDSPTDFFIGSDPNDADSGLWSLSSRGLTSQDGDLMIFNKPTDATDFGQQVFSIDRQNGKIQSYASAGYGGFGLASFDDEANLPADATAGTMLYSSTNSAIYVKTYGGGSSTGGDWLKADLVALS